MSFQCGYARTCVGREREKKNNIIIKTEMFFGFHVLYVLDTQKKNQPTSLRVCVYITRVVLARHRAYWETDKQLNTVRVFTPKEGRES